MKLTPEQIDQTPAGRELDILINIEIFEMQPLSEIEKKTILDWHDMTSHRNGMPILDLVFKNKEGKITWGGSYQDIRSAWAVVTHCQKTFSNTQWDVFIRSIQDHQMCGCIVNLNESEACLVICRAALKVKYALNERGVL